MAEPADGKPYASEGSPVTTSPKVFRPNDVNHQPPAPTAGIKLTRYSTPVKIEFVVPSSQNSFNLVKAHLEIIKLMKEKDPTLEIVPSKEDQAKFSDMTKFPANETEYNAFFEHVVDKQPTEGRKIIVKHSLVTNMKFSDLKFQNTKLMDHMYKNKIWIRYNASDTLQVTALGFMQGIHPRVTHREGFNKRLHDAIQKEMTEAERKKILELVPKTKQPAEEGEIVPPIIKLEVVARTIGFGNGANRITTEAFEIRVPIEIRIEIKEIVTRLGTKNQIPNGRFIPYGLAQTVGAEVHKNMLRLQNDFLANFRLVPVFGITPNALKHVIAIHTDAGAQQMTLQAFILAQGSIRGIETTNRAADLGKVFLISDDEGIVQARGFVDNVIKELYASEAIAPELIHPDFNPPRRGDAPRTSTTMHSYATALAALGNPQDDSTPKGGIAPPPRPAKRNVNMVYDLQGDFPNLPKKNQAKKKSGVPIQNHSNDTSTVATSTVTTDTLAQLRADMKKEFMEIIQKEVRTQIQSEMAAMKQEMTNLGAKMDNLQTDIKDTIKDSIGEAIRASMRASFGEQNQHYQQESQDSNVQYYDPNQASGTPPEATTQDNTQGDAAMQDQPSQENNQDAAMQEAQPNGTCPTATGAQH
jgi:hypothetical protein